MAEHGENCVGEDSAGWRCGRDKGGGFALFAGAVVAAVALPAIYQASGKGAVGGRDGKAGGGAARGAG